MKFGIALLSVAIVASSFTLNGEWHKTYGDAETQIAGAFLEDNDTFIMAINTFVNQNNIDAWILKVDKNGNEIWSKKFGGDGEDVIQALLKRNESYFAIGYTESYGSGEADYWVLKLDEEGNEIWNRTYGSNIVEFASDAAMDEEGIIIAGLKTKSLGSMEQDAWVIKIDYDGNLLWERAFGGSGIDWLFCIERDGNDFIMGGYSSSFTSISWDAWLVKIDREGNEIWNRTYGGGDVDTIEDVIVSDDGYIAAGHTMSYGRVQDAFLMRVDRNGEEKWMKIFGGGSWDAVVDVKKYGDYYILAGRTDSFGAGSSDAWLLKLNENGKEIWNKTFGGRERDVAWSVFADSGYYYLFGETASYGKGRSDAWLIKCGDYTPPKLEIIEPENGYLYLFDRKIAYVGTTIVIGKISVEVAADDKIKEVLFYVNGKNQYATGPSFFDDAPPYEFEFRGKPSLYGYRIDAVGYYSNSSANVADSITFRKI